MRNFIFISAVCLLFSSCSDNMDDELIGEWKLFKTNSDCSQSQDFNDEETFASDGCVVQTIVSNSGISTDFDFCSSLIFYENGEVDVISGDTQQTTTEVFTYDISDDDVISICIASGFCREYTLENGELINRFSVVVSGTPLFNCIRTFTYQK